MPVATELPRWDVSVYFPGIESEEFAKELAEIGAQAEALLALFDKADEGAGDEIAFSQEVSERVEEAIGAYNALSDRMKLARSYIHSFVSTDSKNEAALAKQSEMQRAAILMNKLGTRLTAWVGRLPLSELVTFSSLAREHEFALRRMKTSSEHLMSADEEALASDLSDAGTSAWSRLYGNFSSQIAVSFRGERLPMAAVRNLAYDAALEVRKEAYGAERGGNVVVVLSMRGGADGLSLVVPRGTDHDLLTAARPATVVPEGALVAGDTAFGLHPAFAPLVPLWQQGSALPDETVRVRASAGRRRRRARESVPRGKARPGPV